MTQLCQRSRSRRQGRPAAERRGSFLRVPRKGQRRGVRLGRLVPAGPAGGAAAPRLRWRRAAGAPRCCRSRCRSRGRAAPGWRAERARAAGGQRGELPAARREQTLFTRWRAAGETFPAPDIPKTAGRGTCRLDVGCTAWEGACPPSHRHCGRLGSAAAAPSAHSRAAGGCPLRAPRRTGPCRAQPSRAHPAGDLPSMQH